MQMRAMRKGILIVGLLAIAAWLGTAVFDGRLPAGGLVPSEIESITIYKLNLHRQSTRLEELGAARSMIIAQPDALHAFRSTQYRPGPPIFKGIVYVGVAKMRGGGERRLHLSQDGGFFSAEGQSGRYEMPQALFEAANREMRRFVSEPQ